MSIEGKLVQYISKYDLTLHQAVAKLGKDDKSLRKRLRKYDYTLESVRRHHIIRGWIESGAWAYNRTNYDTFIAKKCQIDQYKSLYDQMDKMEFISPIQLLLGVMGSLAFDRKFDKWHKMEQNEAYQREVDRFNS